MTVYLVSDYYHNACLLCSRVLDSMTLICDMCAMCIPHRNLDGPKDKPLLNKLVLNIKIEKMFKFILYVCLSAYKGNIYYYTIRLFAKFNVWLPDLVFVMDDWTSHKQLTAIYVCVRMYACIQALSIWHVFVCQCFWVSGCLNKATIA